MGRDGNDLDYVGHSAVYDCLGKKVSGDHEESEFTEVVELNKDKQQEIRSQLKFLQDRDHFTVH